MCKRFSGIAVETKQGKGGTEPVVVERDGMAAHDDLLVGHGPASGAAAMHSSETLERLATEAVLFFATQGKFSSPTSFIIIIIITIII